MIRPRRNSTRSSTRIWRRTSFSGMARLLLSYFGNVYARFVTGIPISDCTGGFKCFRRSTLEALDLDRISSSGYSFQIEVNYMVWKRKFRICEIPIVFVDRRRGESKMSSSIIKEAIVVPISE